MLIYFNETELDLPVNDNSYRYRAIKGEHSLTLYYSLPQHVEIPIGAYCVFEGQTYTLERPENFKKHSTRNFEYTLIMESAQAKLGKYKFKDTTTRRLKFSLTAQPKEHLQMLVDNLNLRETGWEVGDCVDAVEKVISYNHAFCTDALSQMAEAFETEWEIVGKTINLCKVEYNKSSPLALSYGRGNGFKTGVGRSNTNDQRSVEILFVQGGERNIDASKYPVDSEMKSRELLLPKSRTIGFDGEHFSDHKDFDGTSARWYVTDADGFSLHRSDKPLLSLAEDSLDCSHIYPSRVGTISEVIEVDADKHFYDIIDTSIPQDLDYKEYLIAGETMTVIFQSGMLTGKEFEVKYIHEDRRFEIVPQEIDGRTMPDEVFAPVAGNEYAVFGMMLPEAYICDDATKSGASWDMFREAVKYMYENEEAKFTFTGELDGIWAKKDWLNIGGKIKLGGYVLFTDNQFQPDGVLIRIVGVKDYINNPHSPTIELSNEVVAGSIASDLRKIETNEVVVDDLYNDAVRFTKRRFRDSQETLKMLEGALDNFSGAINPITVQTMAMLVGDESLQFRFVNDTESPEAVPHTVTFDPETKVLTSPMGIIQHMTIGIKTLSSKHDANEYKFWNVSEFNSPPLIEPKKKYYLYATVDEAGGSGEFQLSETSIGLEEQDGYYHLLVGVLNSEFEGERSYVDLYGFTEVLPGRVTTDKVVSSDGLNFLDFLNNAFRVGNNNTSLSFNTNKDGKMILKGTLVQSPTGDTQPLGFFRGEYNSSYTYYVGDEVTYQGSTYRYIYATPSSTLPTNTTYWTVIAAKGEPGTNGMASDWKSLAYIKSPYNPGSPYDTSPIPSGWQDYPDSEAYGDDKWWMVVATVHWTGEEWQAGSYFNGHFNAGYWSEPIQVTGEQGTDGQFIDFKFFASSDMNPPYWSDWMASLLNPDGWHDQPPQVPLGGSLWMVQAWKQAGGMSLVTTWSAPVRISGEKGVDGRDGDEIEYIYCRSWGPECDEGLGQSPNNDDDYVPQGWTDDPQGVNETWKYEWVSIRKKENGIWGGFSAPVLWAKWGTDGSYISFVFKASTAQPATPTGTNPIPSGWRDAPVDNGSIWWMSKATITYQGGQWLAGAWSVPVKTTGEDGEPGLDGKFWDYRYTSDSSTPDKPQGLNPSGWSNQPPNIDYEERGEYLWMSFCEKNADQTAILQDWSIPVRITGERGYKGENGKIGPAPIYRGEFNYKEEYYGTEDRVDIVEYGGSYYVAKVTAGGMQGIEPTATSYWSPFGAQFTSIATDLLLTPSANIAGWVFRNQRLESQSGNAFLDGNNGLLSLAGGKILLKEDGSGQLANGNVAWNTDGSGKLANGNVVWDANGDVKIRGSFESAANGDRVIIDPESKKIKMINSSGNITLDLSFYNIPGSGSSANVMMYSYDSNGNQVGYTQLFGGRLILNNNGADILDFGIGADGKIMWLVDPARLPTSGSFYGQIYMNSGLLRIRTN
ncbi:MAG: hypothetical protein LBM08_09510 [Dysgonamonadaceae bacterium]|jgi:hypothetical protein|nr:hypothetical protein [Dysgonamonadaceae bacterium]